MTSDTQEASVTPEVLVEVRNELARDVTCSQELQQNGNENVGEPAKLVRSSRRKKSIYQTQDLVREVSPKPEVAESQILTAVANAEPGTDPTNVAKIFLNGKKAVQCNICKRHMAESKLANHIRLMHVETDLKGDSTGQPNRPFKCEYCGKCYAIRYTYKQHVKTHTEGRPKCPECSSTFASAFSLFRHRARNHNLKHDYNTFNCEQCNKGFFSISELALHRQRHSSSKEFECSECKKTFSVKGNLRIHMRTHSKEKLYKCDICENTFSHPYSLVSHRRIHTNDFPYKCEICEKVYRSKHQLTSHKNVHSNERPFKCTECSKTFRSRTAFKMHQDEHKGIKRFTCQFCDRQFQCHGNKLKHERRHVGDKKHKCHICDKGFIEKQELKSHLKVHEKRNNSGSKTVDTSVKTTTSKQEEIPIKVETSTLETNIKESEEAASETLAEVIV